MYDAHQEIETSTLILSAISGKGLERGQAFDVDSLAGENAGSRRTKAALEALSAAVAVQAETSSATSSTGRPADPGAGRKTGARGPNASNHSLQYHTSD